MSHAVTSDGPASKLIGYARIDTDEEHDDQVDTLAKAGCQPIFLDHAHARSARRPELDRAVAHLRPRDTLIVWRLDRLAGSSRALLDVIINLPQRGIAFRSLHDELNTAGQHGDRLLELLRALRDHDHHLNHEAGLEAPSARPGRPPKMTVDTLARARSMRAAGTPMNDIAEACGVSRSTLFRTLKDNAT